MGLDIHLWTEDFDEIYDGFHKYSLSRTFCNLMFRNNVCEHEGELEQIAHITGIDISPFYQMNNYMPDDELNFYLDNADTEAEKEKILKETEVDKENLKGNIDKVLQMINLLIGQLNTIDNLPSLLLETDRDTLDNDFYFAEFKADTGDGYIGNNFGQDLRNFKRFLEYVKSLGRTTVWFTYG